MLKKVILYFKSHPRQTLLICIWLFCLSLLLYSNTQPYTVTFITENGITDYVELMPDNNLTVWLVTMMFIHIVLITFINRIRHQWLALIINFLITMPFVLWCAFMARHANDTVVMFALWIALFLLYIFVSVFLLMGKKLMKTYAHLGK